MEQNNYNRQNNAANDEIDIRALLVRYLHNWYWFAIAVILCLIVAFVYLQRKTPQYTVNSSIMIRGNEENKSWANSEMLQMLGLSSMKAVEDEMAVISSRDIVTQAVEILDLQTDYRKKTRLRWVGQYPNSDIIVEYADQFCDTMKQAVIINVERTSKAYRVKVSSGAKFHKKTSSHSVLSLDEPISTCIGQVRIHEMHPLEAGDKYRVKTLPMRVASNAYHAALTTEIPKKAINIITISTTTDVPTRGKALIGKLIELYNMDAVIDKNMMASNTGTFIDERLQIIANELDTVEHEVESFRRANDLSDISAEVNIALETKSSYQKRIAELETQINLISYIQEYVQDPANEYSLIPANLGVEDQSLTSLIAEYNKMLLDRMKLLRTATAGNPIVAQNEMQIASVRSNIISSINSLKDGLNIAKNDVSQKDRQFNSLIRQVPAKERQYIEIKRQQQIKEQLFLYLYEKREENALMLASTVTPAKIIEAPERSITPVAPKSKMIYLVALILGLCIPAGVLFIYDFFNNTFTNHKEYEAAIHAPFLGQMSAAKEHPVITDQHSTAAELFRLLRTNLKFMLPADTKVPTILVTSSVNGEGKTFIAINMAASMALLGKKVVVIGLDIRKPRLAPYLALKNSGLLTSYLADSSYSVDDIIVNSNIRENLDIIPAGAVPPNPAELLQSERLGELFEELRKRYDYIFVDSAPVGMVSDTFLLEKYTDMTIYVSRAKYTSRDMAEYINEIYDKKRLKNIACVLNGVEEVHSGYGYGYGYGYRDKDSHQHSDHKKTNK